MTAALCSAAGTPAIGAPAAAAEGPAALISQLADSPGWLALGHWQKSRLGRIKSPVQNSAFFLSPSGPTHPEAELAATAAALAKGGVKAGPHGLDVACAFPARALFLKSHGLPVAPAACPEFEAFRVKQAGDGATLVFASAYANNPASMFGHVILRLDSPGRIESTALLGHSVAFLAQINEDDDPLSYTVKGLFGGYPGSYTMDPYYTTVAYYTDGESRDLWEYDLKLTPAERSMLVAHLWEVMGSAVFAYWFTDENCAFEILALLDAARPGTGIAAGFGVFVLPLEAARRVHTVFGSGHPPHWRPSLKRQLHTAADSLTPAQAASFKALRQGTTLVENESDPATLDALIAYLNFRKFKTKNRLDSDERGLLREALVRRSQLPTNKDVEQAGGASAAVVSAPAPLPPDAAHPPHAARFGGGGSEGAGFYELSAKTGLHDLLSASQGYEPFAAIDYFDLHVRVPTEHPRLKLERLTLARVDSLTPYDALAPELSWRLNVAWERIQESADARQLRGEAGVGATFATPASGAAAYALLLATADGGGAFAGGWRAGPGAALGLLTEVGPYRLHAEASRRHDVRHGDDTRELAIGQSVKLTGAWDLRATMTWAESLKTNAGRREVAVSAGHFF